MKKDLASVIRKIADFLGKEITEENVAKIVEFTNIDNMKKNPMSNMEERMNVRFQIFQFLNSFLVGIKRQKKRPSGVHNIQKRCLND